ncbi:hypothetical protein DOTSEDRAFT_28852 [Dothistroma septosporum NZE10]|uniref:Uncharacterized protein n=1 Tax=Dothistroma septosporum (strain NZE10 / CBS 128990) TaxID=675120 RepID=M2YI49_DOTSN|nr:hypothetical protein DOTSEDRAFT_28852 [Dothistroma septosporum NZE10]
MKSDIQRRKRKQNFPHRTICADEEMTLGTIPSETFPSLSTLEIFGNSALILPSSLLLKRRALQSSISSTMFESPIFKTLTFLRLALEAKSAARDDGMQHLLRVLSCNTALTSLDISMEHVTDANDGPIYDHVTSSVLMQHRFLALTTLKLKILQVDLVDLEKFIRGNRKLEKLVSVDRVAFRVPALYADSWRTTTGGRNDALGIIKDAVGFNGLQAHGLRDVMLHTA